MPAVKDVAAHAGGTFLESDLGYDGLVQKVLILALKILSECGTDKAWQNKRIDKWPRKHP